MKLIKSTIASILFITSAYGATTNTIKPEEAPLSPEAALKTEDIPPAFARPFTPKPQAKDNKLASSEAELYKDEAKEEKQQAKKDIDDGFPTPTEEARRLSNLPPPNPSAKDNKVANSAEELTQEKWIDAEPLEKHAENNTEVKPKGENQATKDEELFNQALNGSANTVVKKSDNGFSIEPNKPVVQEFDPDQAMQGRVQVAENNRSADIKELGNN